MRSPPVSPPPTDQPPPPAPPPQPLHPPAPPAPAPATAYSTTSHHHHHSHPLHHRSDPFASSPADNHPPVAASVYSSSRLAISSTVSTHSAARATATVQRPGGGGGGGTRPGPGPGTAGDVLGAFGFGNIHNGIPSIESLKEAVMRSQARSRKKSRLDQATTASNSPPIPEEVSQARSSISSDASTATAGISPASQPRADPSPYHVAATPSYPFPPVRTASVNSINAAFGTMSPGIGPHDKLLPSGTTTPASFAFHPPGPQPATPFANPDFPTPNMYELALLLHSEAGIDAFWSNVVRIATTCYKAERVTLAVPTDSTDLENTPWGQKASFNMADDDTMSLTYLGEDRGRGGERDEGSDSGEEDDGFQGVAIPKEDVDNSTESGVAHEFRDKEWSTELDLVNAEPVPIEAGTEEPFGPVTIGLQDGQDTASNSDWISEASALSPIDEPQRMPPMVSELNLEDSRKPFHAEEHELKGRVFPTLQPLSYEADALLDGSGVSRVLQRGKTVVLSREYRDVKTHLEEKEKRRKEMEVSNGTKPSPKSAEGKLKAGTPGPSISAGLGLGKLDMPITGIRPTSQPPTPLFFVGKGERRRRKFQQNERFGQNPVLQYYSTQQHLHHVQSRAQSPIRASSYEEYEQPVTSPWSQSPAPSPAPRPEPSENPFFAQPKVDEETFNPDMSSPIYSAQEPVNAIGCESSWTVIHIPLVHPSQSKVLNPSATTDSPRNKGRPLFSGGSSTADCLLSDSQQKKAPIAILSMLSPVIPYPSNLIHSLSHFAPLVATAFSLAQTHADTLNQLANIQTKRPKRPELSRTQSYYRSTGSFSAVTSPSDMSSAFTASSVASPAWDPGTQAGSERGSMKSGNSQATTPASPMAGSDPGDGYFGRTANRRSIFSRQNSEAVPTLSSLAKEPRADDPGSLAAKLHKWADHRGGPGVNSKTKNNQVKGKEKAMDEVLEGYEVPSEVLSEDSQKTPTQAPEQRGRVESQKETFETYSSSAPRPRIRRRKRTGVRLPHSHTLLHSYGADYSATFQSLAATTSAPFSRRSSSQSASSIHKMPPPSNKLLRTIIDSIPVHVFTAAPDTGNTTWVNARMLAYRGLSVEEFLENPWDALHPEDRDEYIRRWRVAIRKGEPFSIQVRVRRFDGVFRWFMIRAVPLRDQRGVIVHWFGTNMDIHDQRLAEVNAARQTEMAESESKYRSLANSSPQIVFAATANDGITFANTQWLGYSGQTLDEALRLGFMEYVHAADRFKCCLPGLGMTSRGSVGGSIHVPMDTEEGDPSAANGKRDRGFIRLTKTEDDKPTFSTELRLKDRYGEYRWHLVRCVSVESSFATGEGLWFGTCTDINDHKLLEQKLKEANEAAQRTMDSKTRFLANMSHEIRTPLIGISGMINFLLDTPLNGEQLDYCHTISQSSDGLLSVINDILDLSKVEAGMMRLNPEWFRIHSLVEDAHELLSTMAIAKDLELNFIVEEDVPPVVCGDRVRLRQVLLNVIGNAIKFTSKGEVFSRCLVVPDADVGENEIMIQYECHDTGPGFDSKEEELMFKPFSQIDGSSTRAHGGSGLGLVISRQLVELHGGSLTASSQKGKGSTFVARMKFKLPNPPDATSSSTASPIVTGGPGRLVGGTHSHLQSITASSFTQSPSEISTIDTPPGLSHAGDTPSTVSSSASSRPSLRSIPSSDNKSANSSIPTLPLSSPPDPGSMRLSLPSEAQQKFKDYSPEMTKKPLSKVPSIDSDLGKAVVPPMFSILIVSEQHYSRIAIEHHIRVTLPKNIPNQITTVSQFNQCRDLIGGDDPVVFTHVVINLADHSEIIELISLILGSSFHSQATVLLLTNPTQRTAIIQGAVKQCERLGRRLQFVYKPVKPSRFGSVFDPAKERDASMDRNRDSAQQVVETQKKVFSRLEHDVGNRGYKVLLVEDNRVNQKVLLRFLAKVGLEVETASDGEECVEKVLSKGARYYELILCDLHMPRKDGFQATAEIRNWERETRAPEVPIVALSANVMSDVVDRCLAAGFSRYVSKPVDFRELSATIKDLLVLPSSGKAPEKTSESTGPSTSQMTTPMPLDRDAAQPIMADETKNER